MVYAVGDIGRGVLASLQENPDWHQLKDSEEALAVISSISVVVRIAAF